MANEMSITQDFRQLTLTLPADTVTVNLDVKMLKGQYTYSLTTQIYHSIHGVKIFSPLKHF